MEPRTLLDALSVAERLKDTTRHCYTRNGRHESVAEYQKKGYGTYIMKIIEDQIGEKYDKAYLDASLPAAALYEKLGFSTIKHERYPVENGVVLAYEVMEKELQQVSSTINYGGDFSKGESLPVEV